MVAKRFKKHIFLTTLFLLVIAFVVGLLVGLSIQDKEINEITKFLKTSELDAESFLIEQQLLKSFNRESCDFVKNRIDDFSNQLFIIGKRLIEEGAEKKLGKDNYNLLKRRFHLMQIRTYLLIENIKKGCNETDNVILYYYGTEEGESFEQGGILDRLVENHDVRVFAIELNYSNELTFLESYYTVKETPTIIINYDHKFTGLTDYETLEENINKSNVFLTTKKNISRFKNEQRQGS